MDNPGWSVHIDIRDTDVDVSNIEGYQSENYLGNDRDWVKCGLSPDKKEFWGVGDETKLVFILKYFLDRAGNADSR